MKIWSLTKSADGKTADITLYGVIGNDWWSDVTAREISQQVADCRDVEMVRVHINSEGGDIFAGIAIYNMLNALGENKVRSIIEGLAASSASIAAMAGKTVMGRGAMLMVHNPWAIVVGDADDMRNGAEMLDKAQKSLISIYREKTGKSEEELKAMLDAETWLTAEEAVELGFADEIDGTAVSTVEEEVAAAATERRVMLNGIAFPRDRLPLQILAMVRPKADDANGDADGDGDDDDGDEDKGPCNCKACGMDCPCGEDHCDVECACDCDKSAAATANVAPAAATAPTPLLNRAYLTEHAPKLLAELVAEGRAAGASEERARIQAIDELDLKGCAELVAAAKYGEQSMDAPTLAVAALKAGRQAGVDLLAARREESRAIAGVQPGAPDNTAAAGDARHIQAMVAAINARRGENR